jgi:hypothetical protein
MAFFGGLIKLVIRICESFDGGGSGEVEDKMAISMSKIGQKSWLRRNKRTKQRL